LFKKVITLLIILFMVSVSPVMASTYHVSTGDTLSRISQNYNITISQLKEANNLTSDLIYAGQVLNIPGSSISNSTYTVQSGDTLWKIAQQFNTTVANIISENRLGSTNIYPGQSLKVPVSSSSILSTQGVKHTVHSGDTLSFLANRYNTSVQAITETNNLNSQLLMQGQVLIIPQNSLQPVDLQIPSRQRTANFGEPLEWQYASMLFNVGAVATITDVASGLSFRVKRLGGGNHADAEPLTANDTAILRRIYGGVWSWQPRAIMVNVQGRYLAASMNGMPHSIQTIYNNNFPGHICIHFLESKTHNTNSVNPNHQAMVNRAAGL